MEFDNDLMLDEEEKELLEAFESGKMKSVDNLAEAMEEARTAARNTIIKRNIKSKNINIRVTDPVLQTLKDKANESGIPYQTLISALLYQYASGKIEIKL